MSDKRTKSAAFSSAPTAQVNEMSAAAEARFLIQEIAGPQSVGGKIKSALDRVHRLTGLPYRRVRGLWSGEARAILSEEMDALRRAAAGRAKINEETARDELAELRSRMARLESLLAARLPDMVGTEADRRGASNLSGS